MTQPLAARFRLLLCGVVVGAAFVRGAAGTEPVSSALVPALAAAASHADGPKRVDPPPNAPATVEWNAGQGRLALRYHDAVILDATIHAEDAGGREVQGAAVRLEPAETLGDKVEQRLKFVPAKPQEGVELVLRGTVTGSEEAFPAETDSEAQKRFPYVRNSVGLSRNFRNNAVYDRRWDWVLIGPADGRTRVQPKLVEKERIAFSRESRGPDLEIVFRPLFYQKHKELRHYQPWTYKVWRGSVTGYCSWWAYKAGFDQKALDAVVEVLPAKNLPDFGYRYVQFDDAYQTGGGSPEGFLKWNGKFPGGPQYAVNKIRSGGMEPGIWVFCVFKQNDPVVKDMVQKHPDWFVHDADGKIFVNRGWHALDTTNKDALERLVRPTYRGLKELGFTYVKIDGAGDLVDWGYRKCPEYLKKIGSSQGEALRRFYDAAREELGREIYILGCWGVLPELIGVVDGCRLATDGFRPASFQGFNSWEGVVWRNDPDHCDILPVGREQSAVKTFAVKDGHWIRLSGRASSRWPGAYSCSATRRRCIRRTGTSKASSGVRRSFSPSRVNCTTSPPAGPAGSSGITPAKVVANLPGGSRRSTGPSTIGRCWRGSTGAGRGRRKWK
jgi:hypothetical protein